VHPDDIYLASFPCGDAPGMKLRPVLLLTDPLGSIPEVLVACILSVIPPALLSTDIVLDPANVEGASTRLKSKSVLRWHKLATIHAQSMVRRLGTISATSKLEVTQKLRVLLNL
jgi:mRNA-degrading endonuclease toxin of MazEF toxin-antitoxin module